MSKKASFLKLLPTKKNSSGQKDPRSSDESVNSAAPRAFRWHQRFRTCPQLYPTSFWTFMPFFFFKAGFHHVGMTFEQFLLVMATVKLAA